MFWRRHRHDVEQMVDRRLTGRSIVERIDVDQMAQHEDRRLMRRESAIEAAAKEDRRLLERTRQKADGRVNGDDLLSLKDQGSGVEARPNMPPRFAMTAQRAQVFDVAFGRMRLDDQRQPPLRGAGFGDLDRPH
jgi:hypothetical protein